MEAVLIKKTGQKGFILEHGIRRTGKPIVLIQVDIAGIPEWFTASQVRTILTLIK